MFSVAIVADQPVSRAGLDKLVSEDPAVSVAASVGAADELPVTGPGGYDVVLVELPARPAAATLGLVERLAAAGRPLVLASWRQPPTLLATVRAGARGCITRHTEESAVRDAVRVVADGGFYLCRRLTDRFRDELCRQPDEDPSGLAPREIETLRWIASGFTHAQTATRMGLSEATVHTYAKRIRAKLNVSNKADLTRMAIELGHLPEGRRSSPAA